jgi:hypothetical protein
VTSTFDSLADEKLLDVYNQALKLKLENHFIQLIEEELNRRGLVSRISFAG